MSTLMGGQESTLKMNSSHWLNRVKQMRDKSQSEERCCHAWLQRPGGRLERLQQRQRKGRRCLQVELLSENRREH